MRPIVATLVLLLSLLSFESCERVRPFPADLQPRTLDLNADVRQAGIIVLAIPTSQQHINSYLACQPGSNTPVRAVETETTLDVLRLVKGPPLPRKLKYRHVDIHSGILAGPPQGPSGPLGSSGLYFLRQNTEGGLRSSVDFFRPDIPTSWIKKAPEVEPCVDPAVCVSQLLLTYREGEDATTFAHHLPGGVANTLHLRGFLPTLQFLSNLVEGAPPEEVKRAACAELFGWYLLELPKSCESIRRDPRTAGLYASRIESLRKELRTGGGQWLRRRAAISTEPEWQRYRTFLLKSIDKETRAMAKTFSPIAVQ